VPMSQPTAVRATLIYNPTAGQHNHAEGKTAGQHGSAESQGEIDPRITAALSQFRADGWLISAQQTSGPGAATTLAREAVARGDDVLVVAGGDGTVNEAVQGLVGSATALAVIPLGTVNLWAYELGLPSQAAAAARALIAGTRRAVDVGRAGDRYFLLMAGLGFDAAVTGAVDLTLKHSVGRLAYALAAARIAPGYRGAAVTMQLDDETVRCRALMIVAGNTRHYAGDFQLTPHATVDDGLLDVVVFPGEQLWQQVPATLAILLRQPLERHGARYYRARRLHIAVDSPTLDKTPLPLQIDGDAAGAGAAIEIAVVPGALRAVVPRRIRTPLFSQPG